ncbi:MAG: DNA repair protein RecO [Gammaproteobacteria bacterium]|nr:DNA repair protein RecO [Gammaproteobacteria bacterium]
MNYRINTSSHAASPLSAAYLIHSRPFGETGLIVELITETHGRVAAVANGVKRKKSLTKSIYQPFRPILVSWRGHGDLKTIVRVESPTLALPLSRHFLFSGLYLNELILRLLVKEVPQPQVYSAYHATLIALSRQQDIEPSLRLFELSLMQDLGHGFPLDFDNTGSRIEPDWQYRFHPEVGLMPKIGAKYNGHHLLAIAKHDFCDKITRKQAKALTREMLAPLLGSKPLYSRALFTRTKTISE